jgi:aminobenzoyl-glutamate transport protein
MENTTLKPKKGFFHYVEKGGNALPHPAILFGIFAVTTLLVSLVGSVLGWGGIHPATGEHVGVVNLLSRDGLHRVILGMVNNYTSFAPLGIVMVALLGLGVAETSGLIRSAINALLVKTPPHLVTFMVVFAGIISKTAGDLGYLLIIPLGGVIFHSIGRNPIVGVSAAFAGVSGGFSANVLISSLDPLLAGLTTEAAQIIDSNYVALPTANYYFAAVLTFVLAILATFVTTKWVEPRLGKYTGDVPQEEISKPTALERKGLKRAGLVFLIWFGIIAIGLVPENGVLRCPDGTMLHSPVLKGIITFIFLIMATAGMAYGYTVGTFKKGEDTIKGMNDSFKTLSAYLVLVFFAAQFVAWFRWSNLGLLIAVNGANFLQNADIGLIPLSIMFILFTAFLNFFMGSASAKWALIAPVFVPIFMLLGYSPELAQMVFRLGDTATNVISPMMSFFALIIVYYQKYDKKAGIGTIVASMLPYSIVMLIGSILLLVVWILFNIPLGPGAPIYLPLP